MVGKAGYAAAYASDVEGCLVPFAGQGYELVDIWLDGIYATLHCRDGVRLPLYPYTLAPYGAEVFIGGASRSSGVLACKVAAEYEDLVRPQMRDVFRCIFHNALLFFRFDIVAFGLIGVENASKLCIGAFFHHGIEMHTSLHGAS